MIIEQGSLNVSIGSAFQEILRAQRALCNQNITSASTSASAITFPPAATAASALSMSRRYDEGVEQYEVRRKSSSPIIKGQGQGLWSVGSNSNQRILTGQNEEADQMTDNEQHQSPHATICGKHPAIRIYHRKGKSMGKGRGKGSGRDQDGSTAGSSSNSGTLSMFYLSVIIFPPFFYYSDSHSSSIIPIPAP